MPYRFVILLTLNVSLFVDVLALRCLQCSGYHGQLPKGEDPPSTCDDRNNQCEAPSYCVKIVDRMNPGADYVTYRSDCYYLTTIQINPWNLSYVRAGACFPFQDGSYPVKRWWYCFCNDRDYCNGSTITSPRIKMNAMAFFLLIIAVFA